MKTAKAIDNIKNGISTVWKFLFFIEAFYYFRRAP
jgi:hypothetical protein